MRLYQKQLILGLIIPSSLVLAWAILHFRNIPYGFPHVFQHRGVISAELWPDRLRLLILFMGCIGQISLGFFSVMRDISKVLGILNVLMGASVLTLIMFVTFLAWFGGRISS